MRWRLATLYTETNQASKPSIHASPSSPPSLRQMTGIKWNELWNEEPVVWTRAEQTRVFGLGSFINVGRRDDKSQGDWTTSTHFRDKVFHFLSFNLMAFFCYYSLVPSLLFIWKKLFLFFFRFRNLRFSAGWSFLLLLTFSFPQSAMEQAETFSDAVLATQDWIDELKTAESRLLLRLQPTTFIMGCLRNNAWSQFLFNRLTLPISMQWSL